MNRKRNSRLYEAYCRWLLSSSGTGGDKEQIVPKVVVKLARATVTPPRRWGRRTAEKGAEPQADRWGFRRSCKAGTRENLTFLTGEKVTFFTGGRSLTEGPGMEAGTSWGRPWTGGTPGTTGTEEKTGFSLSTDTESCLSPIRRTKNFSQRRRTK